LAENLRKIRHDIPIIICTGHSALIDEEKSRSLGMLYVMKPIAIADMAKVIREALNAE